jgi:hypothetical protein
MVRAKLENPRNSAIFLAQWGSLNPAVVKLPDTPSSNRQARALALGKSLPEGHHLP